MAKFSDTPKRYPPRKADYAEIYERQFGGDGYQYTVPQLKHRLKMFGRCECGCKNSLMGHCDFDHVIPLALQIQEEGKPPPKIKWEILLPECHKRKTAQDVRNISKAKRLAGLTGNRKREKIPSRPWRTDVKRKFDGTVVRVKNAKEQY